MISAKAIYEKNISLIKKISSGGVLGHFLPDMEPNGIRCERAFVWFGAPGRFYRPFASASFHQDNGELLFYKHCAVDDFAASLRAPLDTLISQNFATPRSAIEQYEKESRLLLKYEQLRQFALKEELFEHEKDLKEEFLNIWNDTVLEELKPYYRVLSSRFAQWMEF